VHPRTVRGGLRADDAMSGRRRYTAAMFHRPRIRHCRACGQAVSYRVPTDDNRERAMCGACGHIDYENPLNVVGTVPVWQDQVLLCRRNIEPRHGYWTLPAGFMELGETTEAGALRETDEEAGARVDLQGLFTLLNVVRAGQLHLYYRARLLDTDFNPGPETIEARLFRESEIPWDDLAFRTVRLTLERYFTDARSGQFGLHCADIS
jgi:ADP-ribose pyrophosphatase YjhB (NUDIX family)